MLVLILALALSACGGGDKDNTTTAKEEGTTTAVQTTGETDAKTTEAVTPSQTEALTTANKETPPATTEAMATTAQYVTEAPTITEEQTEEPLAEPVPTKYEQMAIDFIKAIMNEDFETAYDMQLIDKTFLSLDDFTWYLPRTRLSEYVGASQDILSFATTDFSSTSKRIHLGFALETVDIDLALTSDNEWSIIFDEWYYADWEVAIPKKISATINGVSVKGYEDRTMGRNVVYVIPTIAKKDVLIAFEDTCLGPMEGMVTPMRAEALVPDEVRDVMGFVRDADQKDALYEELLTFLNEIMAAFNEDQDVDMRVFFDEAVATEVVDAFKADLLKGYYQWPNDSKINNWVYTKCADSINPEMKQNIRLDEKDVLCFTVALTKTYDTFVRKNEYYTRLWVRYEDGVMKLIEIENGGIFKAN